MSSRERTEGRLRRGHLPAVVEDEERGLVARLCHGRRPSEDDTAIVRPVVSLVTVASRPCVWRPRWTGVHRQVTRSPTRADDKKFVFNSIVVNELAAGTLLPQPMAADTSPVKARRTLGSGEHTGGVGDS